MRHQELKFSSKIALASMAGAMLAGCTPQEEARPGVVPSAASDQVSCGADKLETYLGALPTPDVLAKMKAASGTQTIRVVGPDDAMTMDFRPDRLTIHTDKDGRIERFRCV